MDKGEPVKPDVPVDLSAAHTEFVVQTQWVYVNSKRVLARDREHAVQLVVRDGFGAQLQKWGPDLVATCAFDVASAPLNVNMFAELAKSQAAAQAKDNGSIPKSNLVGLDGQPIPVVKSDA